jgi:perosamine synthetase
VRIPISSVELGDEEEQLVLEVLRSGRLAQGPMVARLEEAFAGLVGTRHAIATSSGTTALVAAIEALELQPGDEVLTSPFTFVATLNAVLEAGATASFVDIGDDFAIDPASVSAAISDRTRVLLPVHLYGLPADMSVLGPLASEHGLAVVEDAAQAIGATVGDRQVGSFGAGCFSLYATKNITTGEGGMITTDDDELAERIRLLRNQGTRVRYLYEIPGHNYRMTELQAAVGVPQLRRLDATTERRRHNAEILGAGLRDVPGLVLPTIPPGREHVWHQYTVRVTDDARCDRDGLVAALDERGIDAGVYYPRVVFDYPCYREHPRVSVADVPRAAAAARQVVSLPVHPGLRDADVATVVEAVRAVLV